MKIAIAAAMWEELSPFRSYYQVETQFQKGKTTIEEVLQLEDYQLFLVETGIGKVNAACSTSVLCEQFTPDIIINTGSAGAFSPKLAIGDVVVGTEFCYSDVDATGFSYELGQVPQMPASYKIEAKWLRLIEESFSSSVYQVHSGLVVTADSFMSDVKQVEQIKLSFPAALASDMEGTAIAQVASFYEIPVLNIRGISDIAGKEAAQAFDQHLSIAATHAFEQTTRVIERLLTLKN